MAASRLLFRRYAWLALAAVLAALSLRLVIPLGYMPTTVAGQVEIAICHPADPAAARSVLVLPLPAKPGTSDAAERCAFADLQLPMLAALDPPLLALALAFILALWLSVATPPARLASPRLRPPLRGPPAGA